MSVQPREWPEVPEQTAVVARAVFAKGTLAMRVCDELPGCSRIPSSLPSLACGVSRGSLRDSWRWSRCWEFAENLTDRQAGDAVQGADRLEIRPQSGVD